MRSGSLVLGYAHCRGCGMRTGTDGWAGASKASGSVGSELFRELARMVVALAEIQGVRSFCLPYPGIAQRALDQMVNHCLDVGETPPRSLPELWEWCRTRPADDSLFAVPAYLVTPGTTLVHPIGRMPTRSCLEIAYHGSDKGAVEHPLALLDDLEARCGRGEHYRQCRRFLASHPVVLQRDRFAPGWSKSVWSRVKILYDPLPESLLADGKFLRCRFCGLPARLRDRAVSGIPVTDADIWCEGEECPRDEPPEVIREPEQAWILRRSLRAILALPNRTEEATREALDCAGIRYEALPGILSGYRPSDSSARTVSIRVYNRLQPALLAEHLSSNMPAVDHVLVVIPDPLAGRNGYRETFTDALPPVLRHRMVLTTPANLVPDLRRAWREKTHYA
ncbi:pPIWI_RE_Y domain-containing protein [Streptomyces sp. NPDC002431]